MNLQVEHMKKLIEYCEKRGLACLNWNSSGQTLVLSHSEISHDGVQYPASRIEIDGSKIKSIVKQKDIETDL